MQPPLDILAAKMEGPTLESFTVKESYRKLLEALEPYKPEVFQKKYPTDTELAHTLRVTTDIANKEVPYGGDIIKFSKFIELFPGYVTGILGTHMPSIKGYKTDQVIDMVYGIDSLFEFRGEDKFDDEVVLGVDTTSNSYYSMTHYGDKKVRRYDLYGPAKEHTPTYQYKLFNICIYVDKMNFLLDFYNLSSNPALSIAEIYLILLKRYYIDVIYKFLTLDLTRGKTDDFAKVLHAIDRRFLTDYLDFEYVDHANDDEKYLLYILGSLYHNFYNNDFVKQTESKISI